jgi:hypothetical protein
MQIDTIDTHTSREASDTGEFTWCFLSRDLKIVSVVKQGREVLKVHSMRVIICLKVRIPVQNLSIYVPECPLSWMTYIRKVARFIIGDKIVSAIISTRQDENCDEAA